jgi:hypothetical protein
MLNQSEVLAKPEVRRAIATIGHTLRSGAAASNILELNRCKCVGRHFAVKTSVNFMRRCAQLAPKHRGGMRRKPRHG